MVSEEDHLVMLGHLTQDFQCVAGPVVVEADQDVIEDQREEHGCFKAIDFDTGVRAEPPASPRATRPRRAGVAAVLRDG
jgi:hypothetical protein